MMMLMNKRVSADKLNTDVLRRFFFKTVTLSGYVLYVDMDVCVNVVTLRSQFYNYIYRQLVGKLTWLRYLINGNPVRHHHSFYPFHHPLPHNYPPYPVRLTQ